MARRLLKSFRIGAQPLLSVPVWHGLPVHNSAIAGVTGPRSNHPKDDMRDAVSQHLYTYWNEIRGTRLAPKRFEVEPSRISAILPDTFVLERIDTATSRFRLAGTRICEAFAAEFRGLNIMDMFGEEDRITLERQISVIARQGAVGLFIVTATTESGKQARFEMLLLPLVHTRESVDRLLGALVPLDRPAWLGHEPLLTSRLTTNELIWPDGRPHAVIDNMHRQTPFHSHLREARIVRSEHRQFRVYDGGLSKPEDI